VKGSQAISTEKGSIGVIGEMKFIVTERKESFMILKER
jgi:hypothetical protein